MPETVHLLSTEVFVIVEHKMDKPQPTVSSHDVEVVVREKSGTSKDAEDMQRLGKVQELRVESPSPKLTVFKC